jgi:hypothetical protein
VDRHTVTEIRSEAGPATFSRDRRYRYTLTRVWDKDKPKILWVMLNPSTADETKLDPTLRRCLDYSYAWGYGMFAVCNLYAIRSTDRLAILKEREPIGVDNDEYIKTYARYADLVMCGWGTYGYYNDRGKKVKAMIEAEGKTPHYLVLTKDGYPSHPLYLPARLTPQEWT